MKLNHNPYTMMKVNLRLLGLLLSVLFLMQATAQDMAENDEDQSEVRENPEMGEDNEEGPLVFSQYSHYPFLKVKANHIQMNGADWSHVREMLDACDDTVVSIMHIGDSHIQAEGSTTRTRTLLQRHYGSAGRGLIIPFRLAGTNQPVDYKITSKSLFETSRLLKRPWKVPVGFTGVALQPKSKKFDFTIVAQEANGNEPDFDFVKMFVGGNMPKVESAINANGYPMLFNDFVSGDTLTIFLFDSVTEVTLHFSTQDKCQIYGFQLENQMTGIEYHAIGNNGATYMSYNDLPDIGKSLQSFQPTLTIISLGANEAFGRISDEAFYASIDEMVKKIMRTNPETQILLTTPSECQKSATVRTGKGKKRKRTKNFSVNANIPRLRNVILKYGEDNGIATYDWYEVAGGAGSSAHWLKHNLMKSDRIHNTWDGYHLQGDLMYEALLEAFNEK